MSLLFPLEDWAKSNGTALLSKTKTYSFSELSQRVLERMEEYEKQGLQQAIIGIQEGFSHEAIISFLALAELGNIVVLGAPDSYSWEACGCKAVLLPSENKNHIRFLQSSTPIPELCHSLLRQHLPGLVLFTSGSSELPKAVLHAMAPLVERHQSSSQGYRTALMLEMDHLGGLNSLFYGLMRRGGAWIPASREVSAFFGEAEALEVELLPLTPSYLQLFLLQNLQERRKLANVRLITYGAEVMPPETLKRLHALYPQIKFKQTYGTTEFGMLPLQSESDESTWVKLRDAKGFGLRVRGNRLEVRTPAHMIGYLNHPNPPEENGWILTRDVVETRGEYFRILGRDSDFVNVGGWKVSPGEVESALLSHPQVGDALVYPESNPILGQIPVADVVVKGLGDIEELTLSMKKHCAQKLEAHKVPVKIRIVPAIERTQRGKKSRP